MNCGLSSLQEECFMSQSTIMPQESLTQASIPMVQLDSARRIAAFNTAFCELFGPPPQFLDHLKERGKVLPNRTQTLRTKDGLGLFDVIEYGDKHSGCEVYFRPHATMPFQSDEDQSSIFADLPIALLKLSLSGDILCANKMAHAKIGHKLNEMRHINSIFSAGSHNAMELLLGNADHEDAADAGFLYLKGRNENAVFHASLHHCMEQGKHIILLSLADVTALKQFEIELVQKQKMDVIGQLVSGVVHDFKNLLTAISGDCELLMLKFGKDSEEYSELNKMKENTQRANELTGRLLDYARKQSFQFETLKINDVLSGMMDLLDNLLGEKINLSLTQEESLGFAAVDKRQLEQVIMNIIVNARDAMPKGGNVYVKTQAIVYKSAVICGKDLIPKGEYLSITISDEGSGISKEDIDKIFDPFFTTKSELQGTGLGLTIAYGIIKQTGGFMRVSSDISKGSSFEILLPTVNAAKANKPPTKHENTPQDKIEQGEGTVLLVEDETHVRNFAAKALRLQGFTVFEADSGEKALEMLENIGDKIDVFISDVILPGLNGPSWVHIAREKFPDTHVIFISGYTEDSFQDKPSELQHAVFLTKPFSLKVLNQAVMDALT